MSELPVPDCNRILLIDGDPAAHEAYRAVFTSNAGAMEFRLESAKSGEEALQTMLAALKDGRPYSLVFSELLLSGEWDGLVTAQRLWEVNPDLQIVLCTGCDDYSWQEIVDRIGQTDRLMLLMKPFARLEVLQMAHSLTRRWRLLQESRLDKASLERHVARRTRELQEANEKLQAEIADRTAAEAGLRQAQKMEAIGHLAGAVAHDFNNLLSVIRGYTGLMLMDEQLNADMRESLFEVDGAADRASNLTRQLLTFSRKTVLQLEELNPNEVVQRMRALLRCVVGERCRLEYAAEAAVPGLMGDRSMLEQVLLNLVVNARDAMPDGGRIWVSTKAANFDEAAANERPNARAGEFTCLTVRDEGCGIPPEILPRLFEPFFTTKEVGKGTGLGLSTVYGVVQQHEGWVEVESRVGQGTAFHVYLPGNADAVQKAACEQKQETVFGHETVLLVEDDAAVRNMARAVLEQYGYQVHAAESAMEALFLWQDRAAEIDLLLTDVVMPGEVSGRELGQRLLNEKPGLKVIYSSGHTRELSGRVGLLSGQVHCLPKPYSPYALARLVRQCLDTAHETPPATSLPLCT